MDFTKEMGSLHGSVRRRKEGTVPPVFPVSHWDVYWVWALWACSAGLSSLVILPYHRGEWESILGFGGMLRLRKFHTVQFGVPAVSRHLRVSASGIEAFRPRGSCSFLFWGRKSPTLCMTDVKYSPFCWEKGVHQPRSSCRWHCLSSGVTVR